MRELGVKRLLASCLNILARLKPLPRRKPSRRAAERFDIPPERRWRVRGLMRYLAGYMTVRFDDPRRLTAGGHAFDAITLRCGKCNMPRREWDESRGRQSVSERLWGADQSGARLNKGSARSTRR
jgi:hypothetical protein